jgi:hypothetical protein
MSQKIVFQLLKDLGGRATWKQVSELAKERYPDASLHTYVGQQLKRLQRWGEVDYDSRTREYYMSQPKVEKQSQARM